MSENSFKRKVHVVVRPHFETYGSENGEYYVSLHMNPLELQLQGERFVQAARKALHQALQGGKICIYNDDLGGPPAQPGASQRFMHRMVTPEEILLTPVKRLADEDGKSLTDFSNDIKISTTAT